MSRWHDKRCVLPGLLDLCIGSIVGGWGGSCGGRVDHHFSESVKKLGTKVSMLGPDAEQIIYPAMVSRVLLTFTSCRMANQSHDVQLQGPAHREESCIGAQVIFGMVQ